MVQTRSVGDTWQVRDSGVQHEPSASILAKPLRCLEVFVDTD